MNDNDRGPGHGIAQGLFYGFIFMPLHAFPWWVLVITLVLNHARVAYQEIKIEKWIQKYEGSPYQGDFWYDTFMRPIQTDIVACMAFTPIPFWGIFVVAAIIAGFKKKNQWPLIVWWK